MTLTEGTARNLSDLYYFAKVVEAGGFAAAGRLLGIPKSRLSRRIAELEERNLAGFDEALRRIRLIEGINLTNETSNEWVGTTAWKLPLILVCENNLYAEMTPFADTVGQPDVAARATGYGVASEIVDGNDVLAVYAATRWAADRAWDRPNSTFDFL